MAERQRHLLGSLIQIRRLRRAHPEAKFGLNEHSDSSPAEWLRRSTSLRRPGPTPKPSAPIRRAAPIPSVAPVDWRTRGAVTPVKNQGKCGNCWAFSAVSSIESAWAIGGNKLVSLSEEFLTDCNYPQ